MGQKIELDEENKPITKNEIAQIMQSIPFTLPKTFFDILCESNGGECDYVFEYFDIGLECNNVVGFSVVYGTLSECYNLIDAYNNPPEFFPKGLLAFSETGNGDSICFDYRSDPNTDDPSIVYWNHEFEEGNDVSFVAKNFEEFLTLLKDPAPEDKKEKISEEDFQKWLDSIRKRDPF